MKDIIIVGAGGFAREAYYLIEAINNVHPTWHIKGFIDDTLPDLTKVNIEVPVLGTIKDWQPSENEVFAMGISSPNGKEVVAALLKSRGARFATLVHPVARVNRTVRMGEGCIINGMSSIGDCSILGDFVHVAGSMIGQDRSIGDYSTTTGFTNIATGDVGKRCFVSSHAVVLRDIGDDVFVTAGSVVMHKVKSGLRVMGSPAKAMKPIL